MDPSGYQGDSDYTDSSLVTTDPSQYRYNQPNSWYPSPLSDIRATADMTQYQHTLSGPGNASMGDGVQVYGSTPTTDLILPRHSLGKEEHTGRRDRSHYVQNANYPLGRDDCSEWNVGADPVQYIAVPLPPTGTHNSRRVPDADRRLRSYGAAASPPHSSYHSMPPPPRSVPAQETVHATNSATYAPLESYSDADDSRSDDFEMFGAAAVEHDYKDLEAEEALWLARKAKEDLELGLAVVETAASRAIRHLPGGLPAQYYKRKDSRNKQGKGESSKH